MATLADDAYKARRVGEIVTVGGDAYEVLAEMDRPSGYQGNVYRHVRTNDIVVAHRGTEFGREPKLDGVHADGGMVLRKFNSQAADARELTERALEIANGQGIPRSKVLVTGHSLGGCLAQITAAESGLSAETFNAYGAAELTAARVAPGTRIVNHMRATDLVSAASPHIGETRIYATERDIDVLRAAHYDDSPGIDLYREPGEAMLRTLPSHFMDNFTKRGLIEPANASRYGAHDDMIDRYRNDVQRMRMGISEVGERLVEAESNMREEAARQFREAQGRSQIQNLPPGAVRGFPGLLNDAGDVGPAMPAIEAPSSPDAQRMRPDASRPDTRTVADVRTDPSHPDHAMYQQACSGLRRMCDRHGFQPSPEQFDNTALQLVAAAKADPLVNRIDDVVPNRATADAAAGTRLFAVSKPFGEAGPFFHVGVDAAAAARTPAEQSLQQLAQIERDAPAPQRAQPSQEQAPRAPSLHLA